MKNSYKFKTRVWLWPGDAGWHFVSLPKDFSKDIRKIYPKGFVKVLASVGKTSWDTSLFPYKKEEIYLLSIKKSVRGKEKILNGDTINIAFKIK